MPAHKRIRQRRKALNLSLEQVADRLRPYWPTVDKTVISKVENDKRHIAADEIPLFAKALECDPQDLLDPRPD